MSDDALVPGAGIPDLATRIAERTLRARDLPEVELPEVDQPADERGAGDDRTPAEHMFRVDELHGLRIPSASGLPDDVDPPNVVVSGGSPGQARELAELVATRRRGNVRQVDLRLMTPGDLAAVACELEEGDVLLAMALDRAAEDVVGVVEGLMSVGKAHSPDWIGDTSRALDVIVGTGPSARALTLDVAPFLLIARTWTGKVPESCRDWGAVWLISAQSKVCPNCAEEVQWGATKCRYCGHGF